MTIQEGNALTGGGGLLSFDPTTTISNCLLTNNLANQGAGMSVGGSLTIDSSTISGNRTGDAGAGGGILFDRACKGGKLIITNSTISGNSANQGGGIFSIGGGCGFAAFGYIPGAQPDSGNRAHQNVLPFG